MNRKTKMKYNKYRLAGQIRNYDCGPVGIINVMKMTGLKISYKLSYQKLFDKLNVVSNNGTFLHELVDFLRNNRVLKKKLKSERINPTYKNLVKELDQGRVALLAFRTIMSGHVCVIVGHSREGLQIVNWDRKATLQTIGFDKFKKEVLDYNQAYYYFFERK